MRRDRLKPKRAIAPKAQRPAVPFEHRPERRAPRMIPAALRGHMAFLVEDGAVR